MTVKLKERVRIQQFGCVRNVELRLGALHALIGPNDSGKSTILRALQGMFPLMSNLGQLTDYWMALGKLSESQDYQRAQSFFHLWKPHRARSVIRLDPDVLRMATGLVPSVQDTLWFGDERGSGLAGLYDALLGRDRQAFIQLEDQFKKLFPTVKALRLDNTTNATKMLGLTLHDDTVVGPTGMSEGMLYWLAFAIIEHLSPPEMLLIEEPENGLHPSRIREVVRILRKISERTQVVLSTHSPLVINELQPEEVTIVTRTPERGTICTPMSQTKDFQERSEIYALGELWLSFADGNLEEDLVDASAVK